MDKIRAIAFDVYGTLYDPGSVTEALAAAGAEDAGAFAQTWREQQIAFTWRRTIMQQYADFDQVTSEALVASCRVHSVVWPETVLADLCLAWQNLQPFPATKEGLKVLQEQGYACYAFSNGTKASLRVLLHDLMDSLAGIITVEDAKAFKPSPEVYRHFCTRAGVAAEQTLLVSGNYWDVTGALAAGWQACWLHRGRFVSGDNLTLPEQWTQPPTFACADLQEFVAHMQGNG